MTNESTTGTGYSQEDSYFHQKDQELLARKRAQLDAGRSEQASMKCPRCGAALAEVAVEAIKVDRCTGCGGIFLDKGELELLTHAKSAGLFNRLLAK